MLPLVAAIQELTDWTMVCDCGTLLIRDGEGNFDCPDESCGVSW